MWVREMFIMSWIHAKMNQSLTQQPHREGLLAFGTGEGRVGWVQALGKGRMATFFSYWISQGPGHIKIDN